MEFTFLVFIAMIDNPNAHLSPREELAKDFQLGLNDLGQLRKLDNQGTPTDEKFQYDLHRNGHEAKKKNSLRYEKIGLLMERIVFQILEDDLKLDRIPIPKKDSGAHRSFVFATKVSFRQGMERKTVNLK